MLEVEKTQNGHGYDVFRIQTDEGSFYITFENNLDLYWGLEYEENILKMPETTSLIITKENYVIYSLIDRLYQRIVSGNPYDEISDEARDMFLKWTLSEQNDEALVKDGSVCWHSDDYIYENASSVTITPEGDEYIITFKKSKLAYDAGLFMTYSVRIRNSGSRYAPFNAAFMEMYQELINYEPEYHQMHLEELMYKPKMRLLKKDEEN